MGDIIVEFIDLVLMYFFWQGQYLSSSFPVEIIHVSLVAGKAILYQDGSAYNLYFEVSRKYIAVKMVLFYNC